MARTCIRTGVKDQLEHYTMFEPNSGCWLWTGAVDKDGYGKLTVKYQDVRAHRVSYETYTGAIPEGLVACHKCDTPACINPDHLFLGTHADNIADRDAKGRHIPRYGADNGSAKLTEESVRAIRSANGSQKSIGSGFGVSQSIVSLIKRGERWQHIQ